MEAKISLSKLVHTNQQQKEQQEQVDKKTQEAILFRRLCSKGISNHHRGMVWQTLANCRGSEAVYMRLAKTESLWEERLTKDIDRTFPHMTFFKDHNGMGQTSLLNVLRAYSAYDPQLGYCQGMGYLAAVLLLFMCESDAFWMLVSILQCPKYGLLRNLFVDGMPLLQRVSWQYHRLLQKCCPRLVSHFEKIGVELSYFVPKWFMTLFAYSFPLPTVLRVWDLFLLQGLSVIFRVGLAVMVLLESKVLLLGFEEVIANLKPLFASLPTELVIREAMALPLVGSFLVQLDDDYDAIKANNA